MAIRKADAEWKGTLREGAGTVTLGSGAFSGQYSFPSRFEEGKGTNPEELIGAAIAGCYSMALSAGLGKAGHNPVSIKTTAGVHIEKVPEGFGITRIDLTTEAEVPGVDEAAFNQIAEETKKGCPVSRALSAVEITLKASLVQTARR